MMKPMMKGNYNNTQGLKFFIADLNNMVPSLKGVPLHMMI